MKAWKQKSGAKWDSIPAHWQTWDVKFDLKNESTKHIYTFLYPPNVSCRDGKDKRTNEMGDEWELSNVVHMCLSILYGQQQAADGQTWYVSVCQLVMWKWNEKWRRTARNLRSSNCKSIWPPGQASTAKVREAKRKSAGKQKENMSCKFLKNAKNAIVENIFLFHFLSITSYLLANKFGACAVGWLVSWFGWWLIDIERRSRDGRTLRYLITLAPNKIIGIFVYKFIPSRRSTLVIIVVVNF